MGCHTWVYKRIKSLSQEELHEEIDSVIKERKNRWYMHCTAREYTERMKKMLRDSSLPQKELSKETAEKRYCDMRAENTRVINMLEKAKETNDYSIVTGANGFPCKTSNKEFIDWLFDDPFRCYEFSNKQFTDPEELIDFLSTLDPSMVTCCKYGKVEKGLTVELTEKIRELFKKHGEKNLIIEFG